VRESKNSWERGKKTSAKGHSNGGEMQSNQKTIQRSAEKKKVKLKRDNGKKGAEATDFVREVRFPPKGRRGRPSFYGKGG